ncbi:MAG TPA: hypothetical protein VGF01_19470 [Terracidiphilus sp.]|jgi:ABC-type multidrug transport system permease subunit
MKKNLFINAAFVLGLVLSCSASVFGMAFTKKTSPEIDPGLAISALTLLGGTLAVLRVRHKK